MRRKTVMGRLLTDFRFKRDQARKEGAEKLWERNNLSPKNSKQCEGKRAGHEIRENSINKPDGTQLIELSLWKKIDSMAVKVSVDTVAEEVETKDGESIEELMK